MPSFKSRRLRRHHAAHPTPTSNHQSPRVNLPCEQLDKGVLPSQERTDRQTGGPTTDAGNQSNRQDRFQCCHGVERAAYASLTDNPACTGSDVDGPTKSQHPPPAGSYVMPSFKSRRLRRHHAAHPTPTSNHQSPRVNLPCEQLDKGVLPSQERTDRQTGGPTTDAGNQSNRQDRFQCCHGVERAAYASLTDNPACTGSDVDGPTKSQHPPPAGSYVMPSFKSRRLRRHHAAHPTPTSNFVPTLDLERSPPPKMDSLLSIKQHTDLDPTRSLDVESSPLPKMDPFHSINLHTYLDPTRSLDEG